MRTSQKITTSFVAALVAVSPLASLAAHAATDATLTGNVGISLSGDASTSGSGAVNMGTDARATAPAETEPIVITRADVRTGLDTQTTSADASSSESLQTHAKTVVSGDARVSSVELSSDKVALSYEEPAKLFGFIQVTIPVTVAVTADGTTSIEYPWYGFLLSSDRTSLAVRARDAASQELAAKTNTSAKFSVAEQEQILDSLHEVLRSQANGNIQSNTVLR
ncbi:MAG: hypothetical protein ACYC1Y_01760 [Minisyncoccota bacterium]